VVAAVEQALAGDTISTHSQDFVMQCPAERDPDSRNERVAVQPLEMPWKRKPIPS
jgi:hypothetical protein